VTEPQRARREAVRTCLRYIVGGLMDWIGLFGWKGGGWCDGEAGGFVFESGVVIFFDSIVPPGPLHGRASWRFGIAVRDPMSHITLNIIGGLKLGSSTG
jgi:hypothetical protein